MTINCRLRRARSPCLRLKPDSIFFRLVLSEKSISWSNRPTVLAHTAMPCSDNASEIDRVVFLVQRVPSMGSPATSSRRISSIFTRIAEFFFRRCAATARFAYPRGVNILAQQLDSAFGHRMRINSKQCGHPRIAPSADLERLKSREQATLSFIEQAEKQDDGGFDLVFEDFARDPANRHLCNLAARADLLLSPLWIQSEIDKAAAESLSLNQVPMGQVQQALPRFNVQSIVQLARRIACRCFLHKAFAGVQQRSVCGEPDAVMRP